MPKTNDCDVIIIGAGAAGLAAAGHLARTGVKPLVIEARDRIGGRVHTIRENEVPVELGAEFIHGAPPEIFDIVREAGLETRPTSRSPWYFSREAGLQAGGKFDPSSEGSEDSEGHIWKKLEKYVDDGGADISLAEFLDSQKYSSEARRSVEGYVGGFHGAETAKIGVRSLVKTERAADRIHGETSFRLPHGYNQIIRYLWHEAEKNGAKLLLGAPITDVRWKPNQVEVFWQDPIETFTSRAAVITLPTGVLKENFVTFAPPLTVKQEALEKIEMGAALRVVFQFKSKWWNEILRKVKVNPQPVDFLYAPDETISVWWTSEPHEAALLTAWAGGARALKLAQGDRETLTAKCLETLKRIFDVDEAALKAELVGVGYHDWQHDRFSLGAYTYMAPGGTDAPKILAEPIDNTLFFAGEATDYEGNWGTVHGAIASGIRAAREVLAALKG